MVRVFSLSGTELLSSTDVLSVEEIYRQVGGVQ